MTHKIRTSEAGYNAVTETDPNKLTFSSDYNTLKYDISGYVDVVYNWEADPITYVTGSVAHNLGYEPFFYVLVDATNGGTTFEFTPKLHRPMLAAHSFYAYTTTTTLYFVTEMWGDGSTDNKTARFRYFIFRNNLGF